MPAPYTHQGVVYGPTGMDNDTNDPDGLYEKYRVFKEPERAQNHPTDLFPPPRWYEDPTHHGILQEVESFVFVLKPDTDHHARVALAAYAESVQHDKPRLASDLWGILEDLR